MNTTSNAAGRPSRSTGRRMVTLRTVMVLVAGAMLAAWSTPGASAAGSHALIQGSGSSWSANAVDQWIADVQANGLQVVYTPSGSANGRRDFAYRTTDFAVSEIGYQGRDPLTGAVDTSQGRDYAYMPIVAGGTSFPYQIKVGGRQVRDLRLSGETLAKIFTNQITNWDDPQITKDNNGRKLPSLPIIPVVHAEGSGSSAQLTKFLAQEYPSIWSPFAGSSEWTEYYPRKGNAIAQTGSDGMMNFITAASSNGAIGYVEYSYALGKNYPVAKLLNRAGYFTLPTQFNVAVSLTKAIINENKSSPDYLLQDLRNVYTFNDARTYPLSSYSYMIIPTSPTDSKMTTAKRQTIADFLYYNICQGQQEVGAIGYSPLPVNLVQAGFEQIGRLKQADKNVDLTKRNVATCNNPTFIAGKPKVNHLAEIAPMPPACDKVGAGPCADGVTSNGTDGVPQNNGGGGNNGGNGSNGGGNGGVPSNPGTGGTDPGTGGTTVDPITGQTTTGGGTVSGSQIYAVPAELAGYRAPRSSLLLPLGAVALLLLALALPPVLSRRRSGADAPGGGA
jgi:phosphate transport system substrate-binding protein